MEVTCSDVHVIFLSHLPELAQELRRYVGSLRCRVAQVRRDGYVCASSSPSGELLNLVFTTGSFRAKRVMLRRAQDLSVLPRTPRPKSVSVKEDELIRTLVDMKLLLGSLCNLGVVRLDLLSSGRRALEGL